MHNSDGRRPGAGALGFGLRSLDIGAFGDGCRVRRCKCAGPGRFGCLLDLGPQLGLGVVVVILDVLFNLGFLVGPASSAASSATSSNAAASSANALSAAISSAVAVPAATAFLNGGACGALHARVGERRGHRGYRRDNGLAFVVVIFGVVI